MPDISMCANEMCKRRSECYRYTATPSDYQSYMEFDDNDCEYFCDNKS